MSCYLEHTAIPVGDIAWHIHFFRDVLGMSVRQLEGDPEAPKQVWFRGGIQLKSAPGFCGPEGRLAHLGIMTDDLEGTLASVYAAGAEELPRGRGWVKLPDGLELEFIEAKNDAVRRVLEVNPWEKEQES